MSLTRRELLRQAGGLAACAALPVGCTNITSVGAANSSALAATEVEFLHGVASGDPLPDAVILWTRVSVADRTEPLEVGWEVSEHIAFRELVASGTFVTDPARDFTVKVDVTGLQSGRLYYYRFMVEELSSPVGRTRTAPRGAIERLRFGVASCSSYAHGYFHGYRSLSEQPDLDAVIHLGDYIYEYGTGEYGDVRSYDPEHEIVSLDDYRLRYAQYRRDPDLQALHQQVPMIVAWDDHEVANNAWTDGAQNHMPDREGEFSARKAAAVRAYMEWMPIRDQEHGRSFRALGYGELVDLVVLDTRNWGRNRQLEHSDDPALLDDDRTLLGDDQEAWLGRQLAQSTSRWRLLAQQVMVNPFALGTNLDSWQGYPAARARLMRQLADAQRDCVILTGDVHSSWAMNLLDDDGESSLAVELVTPGITSPLLSREKAEEREPEVMSEPHVEYAQLWKRGYMVLDIDRERVLATWHHYERVDQPEPTKATFGAAATVYHGERRVRMGGDAALPQDPDAASASG